MASNQYNELHLEILKRVAGILGIGPECSVADFLRCNNRIRIRVQGSKLLLCSWSDFVFGILDLAHPRTLTKEGLLEWIQYSVQKMRMEDIIGKYPISCRKYNFGKYTVHTTEHVKIDVRIESDE